MMYQQVGTSIDTKVLLVVVCLCRYCVSYHIPCHSQPSPIKTSALHLEPGLNSQMLRHLEAFQVTYLWYQSSMTTLLNHASPLSVFFKEVLWMLCVALNQIKSQLEFVTMIVSTGMRDSNTIMEGP